MANHPSALKRYRQSQRRRLINQMNRHRLKTQLKKLRAAITGGKPEEVWGVLPNKGYLVKQTPQQRADLEEYLDRQTLIVRHDLPAKNPKPEFKDHQLDKAVEYVREQIKLTSKLPAKKAG